MTASASLDIFTISRTFEMHEALMLHLNIILLFAILIRLRGVSYPLLLEFIICKILNNTPARYL